MSLIEDLAAQLAALVPPGGAELKRDLEKNFGALLQSAFARMDLVTREQFEVQSEVLARTRAKVDLLQQQVVELERRLGVGGGSAH